MNSRPFCTKHSTLNAIYPQTLHPDHYTLEDQQLVRKRFHQVMSAISSVRGWATCTKEGFMEFAQGFIRHSTQGWVGFHAAFIGFYICRCTILNKLVTYGLTVFLN